MQQLIIHQDGEFYANTAQFAFVDPTTGIRFEPRLQIKTKPTAWMQGQPTIKKVEAEAAPEPVKQEPMKVPVKATK